MVAVVWAERRGGSLRTFSFQRDFGAIFQAIAALRAAQNCRTLIEPSARRHRHMRVGDFSAQCLNGRRQAMILRLRGVALFRRHFFRSGPSARGVPAGRKRHERPDCLVVVGGLRRLLGRCLCDRDRRCRSQRQAQTCTLQIHCGRPGQSILLKICVGLKTPRVLKTARSQIAHAL